MIADLYVLAAFSHERSAERRRREEGRGEVVTAKISITYHLPTSARCAPRACHAIMSSLATPCHLVSQRGSIAFFDAAAIVKKLF
jgi:hypothetical protein